MTIEPLISHQIQPANKFLWAVKTYLDLISKDDPLVYGSGLKRLYAMTSGIATLNDSDIEAIVSKSERLNLIPQNLHGFMTSSILKNIELYGRELQRLINDRIVSIANGDISNAVPFLKFSAVEARRFFYVPPTTFINRLQKALIDDTGYHGYGSGQPQVNTFQDVANDAVVLLTQMQINEGYSTPTQTSWGALTKCVEGLVETLESEAKYPVPDRDYRIRARACLKILWFIAKLLIGDLTVKPLRQDVNMVDLDQRLNLSDGTLASIPFPLPQTVSLFSDDDGRGITLKGRFYLSAISAAAFYRGEINTGE